MDRFLERRVIQEFIGESSFDDATIKHLLREYIQQLDFLKKERDPRQVNYIQGYVAAFEKIIQVLREQIRKQTIQEEE